MIEVRHAKTLLMQLDEVIVEVVVAVAPEPEPVIVGRIEAREQEIEVAFARPELGTEIGPSRCDLTVFKRWDLYATVWRACL